MKSRQSLTADSTAGCVERLCRLRLMAWPTKMVHMHRFRASVLLLIASTLSGCTSYEFVITQPPEFGGHLTKQERTIERPPLVYHLVDQSIRLGIRIENPTDDPILLKGDASYVVTPDGQSQPLRSGTIAPHAWAGFSVPPVQRTYRRTGILFGMGVGTSSGHTATGIGVGYDPFYDDFAYVPTDQNAWQWKEGSVRLHLEYERQGQSKEAFAQEFTVERRKAQ